MPYLALFIFIIAGYLAIKVYSRDDHKLPPASTKKGKEARIVIVLILIPLIALLFSTWSDGEHHNTIFWISASLVVIGIPIVRYFQFKKKK